MNSLVNFNNGVATVTSKDIADNFGKFHKDVLRAISLLDCSAEFRERNFAPSYYVSPQNKKLSCFSITRDGFAYLCMGFTGKKAAEWKERYIAAFNEMESYIKHDINDSSLISAINVASLRLDDLKAAGSAWGKTGIEIRKHKQEAIQKFCELLDEAQLKLGFDLI